jgi:hypothetical protein
MKAYLDGIPVAFPEKNLKHPSFTLRRKDETGDRAFSFTGDLTFTGSDYNYLYSQLIESPNALNNKVVLKFVNDCCSQNQTYEFYIDHRSLTWCEGQCELKASAIEKSIADDHYTCLMNTMIWDDTTGFKSKQHPRISYCNELRPNWLHDALIIITIATWTSFLTIGPLLLVIASIVQTINFIINVVNAIIGFINSIGGSLDEIPNIDLDGDPSTNAYTELNNWVKKLLANSFGCGRKHPSPLIREYAANVCGKCGLTFQSSIFNDPASDYYNAVYHNAPIDKGVEPTDTTTYWLDKNAPILNGVMFFDKLKGIFNSKFDIINNNLILERRDFFTPKNPWLDLTNSNKVVSVCWEWSVKNRYSYADFRYQKDAVNWVGSEANSRWSDIVEWNNPYNNLQKGAFTPLIEFASARFRDDGIDRDVLTFYEDLPTIGTILKQYKNAMLMNAHCSYSPMILIWDGNDVSNASVSKFFSANSLGIPDVGLNQYYNYAMWFKEGYPGNLYDRFWYIDDPRISGYQGKDFTAVVSYDCQMLSDVDLDGQIITSLGLSNKIDSIVIDDLNKTLTIKGTV